LLANKSCARRVEVLREGVELAVDKVVNGVEAFDPPANVEATAF
jgi:hypothetical protein